MKKVGAEYQEDGHCAFTVWAPQKESMTLHLIHPKEHKVEMQKDKYGYFKVELTDIQPGTKYFFMPDGETDYPDPASNYQPEDVHGPSQVVNHSAYAWQDTNWRGLPFKDLVLYELHVGTFTKEGTFEAIIPLLNDIAETGINAIELLPVSQFPGNRNWGYDGVYPYAVQASYGGPDSLKKLVDACHTSGIAVFLDVVYNHLGPEGNYFAKYGPYFTDQYCTPWGDALNFDGAWSDGVREYFSNNPLYWFEHYHLDGLRLDAIHTVYDTGAVCFWELTHNKKEELEQKLGRPLHMIAESDLNSPKVVKAPEVGGYGFTAQWLDDFHHALYVLLHQEGQKYYEDFGQMEQLAKAYTDGFVHSGEYVGFRKRKHGASSVGVPSDKFVVFTQNHDQVGNHVGSLRLSSLIDFERLKLGAAAIILAPYVPMLFMGDEYAEEAPFYYFISHSDTDLIKAVKRNLQTLTGMLNHQTRRQKKPLTNLNYNGRREKKVSIVSCYSGTKNLFGYAAQSLCYRTLLSLVLE
ncbi:malto-oligosyltrehalose trehalohydrolase [Pontibacter silvestris]|uniref:Malto-oligosyltrehalose trehalohydrolase n=1 Tax=Pontibacter silvestris TaxID=2305183 RepID=A0ABW4X1F3_9BACT|nr:malto-oligosyltrehalose trehalohydrolase [Pontibacter silvestris]MCC9136085.1 malto-oligosyltrehalose trehalohydrolase [Pontibacter silvestris]